MENVKKSYMNIAVKWAVINLVTSIVITYAFEFLNVSPVSAARYLAFIPFIAFLLMAQKEYKDQLGGFITFGQGFMAGFMFSIITGILSTIFIYIYYSYLSPQAWQQMVDAQIDKLAERNLSGDQLDQAKEFITKYSFISTIIGSVIGSPFIGAIISLIGAAIFKKERSITDIENSSYTDPAV